MTAWASDALRYLGALATIVVGAVHLQQYADFIHDVPTIGVLFLLNAAGAGAVAVMLATRRATLAAAGGIALSLGAIISVAISMTAANGLFDYIEPTFRAPVMIAVVAEAAAVLSLLAYLLVQRAPVAPRTDWSTSG
jgi:predicted ABC-type sugar transport system permease subunit